MDKPKSDPNCRWCQGTGEVALVITIVPCDCVKAIRLADGEIKLADDDDELSTTNTGHHI